MKNYLKTMDRIMSHGQDVQNRTGVKTRSLFGMKMKFNLQTSFPAVTTKELNFKSILAELVGFLNCFNNTSQFNTLGTHIWDKDATLNTVWAGSPYNKGRGDLGRLYGQQWRRWNGNPSPLVIEHKRSRTMDPIELYPGDVFTGHITNSLTVKYPDTHEQFDQLQDVIDRLKASKESGVIDRRLVVSAWNPWEIHSNQMALPPCHVMFQLYQRGEYLDMSMYQRSADMFLGVPFNIASYALLLHIICELTGYKAGSFVHMLGDVHIYHSHFDAVKKQLTRSPLHPPQLAFTYPRFTSLDDFCMESVKLMGYNSYGPLRAPMETA